MVAVASVSRARRTGAALTVGVAALVGEIVAVERVPIEFDVTQGTGYMRAGDVVKAQLEAHRSPEGRPTVMQDFALSGVLGRTAYASMPTDYHLSAQQHGFDFSPNSATQFEFHHVA